MTISWIAAPAARTLGGAATLVALACVGRTGREVDTRATAPNGTAETLLAVLAVAVRTDTAPVCLALRAAEARTGELGADPPATVVAAVRRAYPAAEPLSDCRARARAAAPTPGGYAMTVVWAPSTAPIGAQPYAAGVIDVRRLGPLGLSGMDFACRRTAGVSPSCRLATSWSD